MMEGGHDGDLAKAAAGLPFVTSLERLGGDCLPIRYRAELKAPDPCSPYFGATTVYPLEIEFGEAAKDGMAPAPRARFLLPVAHFQVPDSGRLDPLLSWNWMGRDPAENPVRWTLRLCGAILNGDLIPEPEEETLDEAWLLKFWEGHKEGCHCLLGSLLPCGWDKFSSLSTQEQKTFIAQVQERWSNRKSLLQMSLSREHERRLATIEQWRKRTTFPQMYDDAPWPKDWFVPSFYDAIRSGSPEALIALLKEEANGVYSFDMLTEEFCETLMGELRAYEASDLPKARPNSMNNYGLILNEIGMYQKLSTLMEDFIQPLTNLLFKKETGGFPLDFHHSFLVQYKMGEDINLDMHTDDSEVTLNVNLCDDFEGASLTFCGRFGARDRRTLQKQYEHVRGRAVIHLGMHTHGAKDLESGERVNLIVWARSSRYRETDAYSARYRRETLVEEEPDSVCLSKTHDKDYGYWIRRLKRNPSVDSDQYYIKDEEKAQ